MGEHTVDLPLPVEPMTLSAGGQPNRKRGKEHTEPT